VEVMVNNNYLDNLDKNIKEAETNQSNIYIYPLIMVVVVTTIDS